MNLRAVDRPRAGSESVAEAIGRDVAAIREDVSALLRAPGRYVASAQDMAALDNWCALIHGRLEHMDADLYEVQVAMAWHAEILHALAGALGLNVEPDERTRRAVATQVAIRTITGDEIFARDARDVGSPEEFRPWAEESLGELLPANVLENVDYQQLYARLR